MKTNTKLKILVTLVLVWWYFNMPQKGYIPFSDDYTHLTYMLCHANIWHLAANVFALWMIRDELYLTSSILIAFLFSFAPVIGTIWEGFVFADQTMGFSGVIFAICGIKWGRYIWRQNNQRKKRLSTKAFVLKVLPWAFIGVLIPHVNWCLHLYCMLAGFVYGRCRR